LSKYFTVTCYTHAGADETLRFWRVFGEPPLAAKDEKAGLLSAGGGMLAGAPLGGLRSIR